MRSVNGFSGPQDSRSESGDQRGNHDWIANIKSFIMNDLRESDS